MVSLLSLIPTSVSGRPVTNLMLMLAIRMLIRIALDAVKNLGDLSKFDCLVTDTACQIRGCMLADWYDKVLSDARDWKENIEGKYPRSVWVELFPTLTKKGKAIPSRDELENLDILQVSHEWQCFIICRMLTIVKDEHNGVQITTPNNLQKFGKATTNNQLTSHFLLEMTDLVQSLMTSYSVEYLQSISKHTDVKEALSDKNIQIYKTSFTHGTFKNNQVHVSKDRKAACCFYGTLAILQRAKERNIPIVLRFQDGDDLLCDNYSNSKCFIVYDCVAGENYSDECFSKNLDVETIILADAAQHPQFIKSECKSLEPKQLHSAIDDWKRRAESLGIGNSDSGSCLQVLHVRAASK